MKTIVLHVGAHKTGSTSIQKTLKSKKIMLRQRGIGVYKDSRKLSLYRGFTDCPQSCHQFYRGWHEVHNRTETLQSIRQHFTGSRFHTHLVSDERLSLLSESALLDMRKFF